MTALIVWLMTSNVSDLMFAVFAIANNTERVARLFAPQGLS
jgi:hypothetical protein